MKAKAAERRNPDMNDPVPSAIFPAMGCGLESRGHRADPICGIIVWDTSRIERIVITEADNNAQFPTVGEGKK